MRANNADVPFTGTTIFLMLLFIFLFGCLLGYAIEVLFRRLFTAKKWVNPGFMKGPWLPLYGFGLLLMFSLTWFISLLVPTENSLFNPFGDLYGRSGYSSATVYDLIPLFLIGVSMTLLELIAGLIFVKGFKVKLWDYSNMKGNFQGIICPLFSLIWFLCGVIYYYLLNPVFYKLFKDMYNYIFSVNSGVAHFGIVFTLGLVYGVFLVDLVFSIGLFARIEKIVQKSGIITRYETLKAQRVESLKKTKEHFETAITEYVKIELPPKKVIKNTGTKFYTFLRKAFLIDPDKKTSKDNFDENGRPKKDDSN